MSVKRPQNAQAWMETQYDETIPKAMRHFDLLSDVDAPWGER
jgi:hypothetical protein